jgi:hypothetical protein
VRITTGAGAALVVILTLSACSAPNGPDAGSATRSAPPSATSAAPAPTPSPASPTVPEVPRVDADASNQAPVTLAPTTVRVDSLDVSVTVRPEGLADDGSMALPEDPSVASWYRFGSGPASDAGATVIAAHVDSIEYAIGPFSRLVDAQPGTEIVVGAEDGSEHRYRVESVDVADKTGVPWDTVFDRSGAPRLVLITCGGEFDYDTGHYVSNVIVTAVPL